MAGPCYILRLQDIPALRLQLWDRSRTICCSRRTVTACRCKITSGQPAVADPFPYCCSFGTAHALPAAAAGPIRPDVTSPVLLSEIRHFYLRRFRL